MKRRSLAVFGLLVVSVTAALRAKGDMVLVEVKGPALPAPIRVTDAKIQEFNVWAGPGVNGSGLKEANGFIANWKQGVVAEPPPAAVRYEISFYAGCVTDPHCRGERPRLVYVVTYAYDASSGHGFVHLVGRDDAYHDLNWGTIYHGPGVEGHWFFTTGSWDNFIRPIIRRTTRA